jgi:hypothetical protein
MNYDKTALALLGISEILLKSKDYDTINNLPKKYNFIVTRAFEIGRREGAKNELLKNKVFLEEFELARKQGAKQELEIIWKLCEEGNMQTDDISRIATYISLRLKELD